MKVCLFLANGFEEIEAVVPIDMLRRAGIDVRTVSISSTKEVIGAHDIAIQADELFDDAFFDDAEMLILPGGMPGTKHLDEHVGLCSLLLKFNESGKRIAAICAAPMILGKLNILVGKKATCYPNFESFLGDSAVDNRLVVSDNIITAQGAGVAFDFALCIIENLLGKEVAEEISKSTLYHL